MVRVNLSQTRTPAGQAASPPASAAAPRAAMPQGEPLILPFRIIADLRERPGGWKFQGIVGDSGDKYRPLVAPMEYRHMVTADYTVEGVPIFIERKSVEDFISTITHGRENFVKEHERMKEIEGSGGACCVIIEGSYEQTMRDLDAGISGRKVSGSVVRGSVAAQLNDFGIPWMWAGTRRLAEEMAFWVLRKAWERAQK